MGEDQGGRKHGFWCCPTPGCDGKGFGFDILPTDPTYQDENGGWINFDDDAPSVRESIGPLIDRLEAHNVDKLRMDVTRDTALGDYQALYSMSESRTFIHGYKTGSRMAGASAIGTAQPREG